MEYYHHHLWGQRGNHHTFPETEILRVLLSHGNGKGEVKAEITGLSWDLEMRRSGFGVNQGLLSLMVLWYQQLPNVGTVGGREEVDLSQMALPSWSCFGPLPELHRTLW